MINDDWDPPIEVPSRKVTEYLLNVAHPTGGPKARFFLGFGFSLDRPEIFAEALIAHLVDPRCDLRPTFDGERRTILVEGSIMSPDGRNPRVRTVWQSTRGLVWRLLTAYPAR